jgi:hypothetical protein
VNEATIYGLVEVLGGSLITAATITAAVITAATITAAAITAAAITAAAITAATITAATTARRRRNPDSTAAAALPTATAPRAAATPANRTNQRGTQEEATCFGVGGNGGSSECEGRCEHDGYPAHLQQHDTSSSVCLGANPHLDWLSPNSDVKQGKS